MSLQRTKTTLLIVLVVALTLLALLLFRIGTHVGDEQEIDSVSRAAVSFGLLTIPVEIADTPAQRRRGLSDRISLPSNTGMLFVFDTPGKYSFWMKDMHFPIDILWLDAGGCIVELAEEISPDSYPTIFSSSAPAQFVLEVNAGFADKHNLERGKCAQFDLS